MRCKFEKLIFPKTLTVQEEYGYMVAVFKPCEVVKDGNGNSLSQIKAVGYGLPTNKKVSFELIGHWTKSKHGLQFEVERYEEVIIPTEKGIIAYLSSGQIKGVGPKTAQQIYAVFGPNTLEILDKEPEKLLTITGISKKKLEKIKDSYLLSRGARDIITFLAPYGVSPKRAVKLFQEYGADTMKIVKQHPYRLCELAGIGFRTADKLAMNMGFAPLSPERVDEGLLYTLTEAEGRGHLCMEKHAFIKAAMKLLDTEGLTEEMTTVRAARLVESERLSCYENVVYRSVTARVESSLANAIYKQLNGKHPVYPNIEEAISSEEKRIDMMLAPEQKVAVKTALSSRLSVITGGPGTGKTSVQKAILNLYHKRYPNNTIRIA